MRTEAKDQSAAKRLGAQADKVDPAGATNRGAFTLVELLVVIGILGVLAALITPAVFQARVSARNAAIKAEIDMLHMAIMNYKNEFGSFPPCTGLTAARNHVQRIFPRTASISTEITTAPTKETSLYYWLEGYTKDPTSPVKGGARSKLFDFDTSRTVGNEYHAAGKPGSIYRYIDYTNYASQGAEQDGAGSYHNPATFQIHSPGLDEQWGTEDDLSNFWKGTRQDYLDSLE